MSQPSSPEKILEWEEKIRQQKLSGLTIQSWCRHHHVTPCSFHYWKKRLTASPLTTSLFLFSIKKYFLFFSNNWVVFWCSTERIQTGET